jgi:competence protein ComEC
MAVPQQAPAGLRPLHFVTAPAFFVSLFFGAGIALSQFISRPPSWMLLAAALGFFFVLLCPRVPRMLTIGALLAAWFAAGMFCVEAQPWPQIPPSLISAADGGDHAFSGTVLRLEPPRHELGSTEGHWLQTADITLTNMDGATIGRAGGGLRIIRLTLLGIVAPVMGPSRSDLTTAAASKTSETSVGCGDTLRFSAKLHPPPRYFTPGAWNGTAWLAQQGIFAEGSLHITSGFEVVPTTHAGVSCALATARQHSLERMDALVERMSTWPRRWQFAALTPQDASILAAALLGDRTRLAPGERTAFQRVGAFHLLVVSGLSIALLAGICWWLLRRCRVSRLPATLITLTLLTMYAWLTGFNPPVQRALLMTAFYMAANLLHRQRNALNTLSVAALILLVANPAALFDASLQMTLLAVLAIAGVAAPLLARSISPWRQAATRLSLPVDMALPPRLAQFRITLRMWVSALYPLLGRRMSAWIVPALVRSFLRLGELAFVSSLLELALALPMAVDFHRVTVVSVFANLLTVPLLGLLLPVAVATMLLSLISMPLAMIPATVTACLLHLASAAVHRLSVMPSAEWRVPPTRPLAAALALTMLLAAIFMARRARGGFGIAAFAAMIAMGILALWSVPLRIHPHVLEVTALDVGQGDSLLIVAPNGATLLVDAGGPAGPFAGGDSGDFWGEDIVSPYLWSRGIRRLDVVALTHAHSDHMGGMPDVLSNFRPHELWVGSNPLGGSYLQMLALAQSLGISVKSFHAGDAFPFSGTEVNVLSPDKNYQPGKSATNDDSLVLHIGYDATSVLLEGDAQHASEKVMLALPGLHADLLKVGHHGSLSSTTPAFLAAVSPSYAVISAGRRNLYGHPRFPILQRLDAEHAHVYRTDMDGASTFILNGRTVQVGVP